MGKYLIKRGLIKKSSPRGKGYSRTFTENFVLFCVVLAELCVVLLFSSHWYLAVICFPGHTGATYINEIPDEDDETNAEVQWAINCFSPRVKPGLCVKP